MNRLRSNKNNKHLFITQKPPTSHIEPHYLNSIIKLNKNDNKDVKRYFKKSYYGYIRMVNGHENNN